LAGSGLGWEWAWLGRAWLGRAWLGEDFVGKALGWDGARLGGCLVEAHCWKTAITLSPCQPPCPSSRPPAPSAAAQPSRETPACAAEPTPPRHPKAQLCCIDRTPCAEISGHRVRLMYRGGRLVIFRSVFLWPVSRPPTASSPAKACHLKRIPNRGGSLVLPSLFCSVASTF